MPLNAELGSSVDWIIDHNTLADQAVVQVLNNWHQTQRQSAEM
jgi:hypothetical protein